MNKIILFLLYGILYSQSNLFFSEYAEGSSNNKYLEIYNTSDQIIELNNYAFPNSTNGADVDGNYDYWNQFDQGSVILPNDVFVICHPSADASILDECDQEHTYLSNGDDGFCLVEGNESNFNIIDCIGDWNSQDPGDGWDVAGVVSATKDHTLVRNPTVISGNFGDWNLSAGTNESDSEWIVYEQNEWDYIGFHLCTLCGTGGNEPLLFVQSPIDNEILNTQNFSISFSVYNFVIGTDGYILYTLDGTEYNFYDNSAIAITNASEGNHNLTMELVDNSGNSLDPAVMVEINFTISLPSLTDIADIQDDFDLYDGQIVIVQGVVTIGDDLLYPGKTKFYIQDGSGKGIQIYNATELSETYNRGDFIEVTGTVDKYNDDVEIIEPTISLIDTNHELPEPYVIMGDESLAMNGTWANVSGELIDYWHYLSGTTEFTALTISIDNGLEIQTMFWNSAVPSSELNQFNDMVGEEFSISGVITFYNGDVQITCGYFTDIESNLDPNLPVADAGENQFVLPGELVYLDGTGSSDSGQIVAYEWVQLDGSSVTLDDEESPITFFVAPSMNDIITFRLTIWDDDINESTDEVIIIIQDSGSFMEINSIINNCIGDDEQLECDGEYDLSTANAQNCPLYENSVTTVGTIIDYFDITPWNGPHSFTIAGQNGSSLDFVVWPESSEYQDGFDITQTDLNILTQTPFGSYEVQITGELGAYCDDDELLDINSEWQITVEYESDIIINTQNNIDEVIPTYKLLSQNYPNPFNPSTVIDFNVVYIDEIDISIYDISGNLISNLINEKMLPGKYSVTWDGNNLYGKSVPSGVYFYKYQSLNYSLTKHMLLVK